VRPSVEAVLKAHFWSGVTGSYWENEMLQEAKRIRNLSLADRLAFYKAILLNCKLDNYRALLFIEVVGDDAEPMRQELVVVKTSPASKTLTDKQRKSVEDWIDELQIVSEQRRIEAAKTECQTD
jgi:hypothetical protein